MNCLDFYNIFHLSVKRKAARNAVEKVDPDFLIHL